MGLRSFFEVGSEVYYDGCDVVSGEADLLPDLGAHLDQSFGGSFDVSAVCIGDDEGHHFVVLKILPDAVRCYNNEPVLGGDVGLGYLGSGIGACAEARFVPEGTSHGQAWHIQLLHPHPQGTQILPFLILLAENSPSKLLDSLSFILPFRLLIIR